MIILSSLQYGHLPPNFTKKSLSKFHGPAAPRFTYSPPSLTKKGLSKLCNSTGPHRQVSFTCWRGQWDGEQRCCRADNVDTGQGVALHIGKPFNGLHDDDTKAQRDKDGTAVLGNALDNIRHQSSAAEDGCLACGGSRPALAATTQLSEPL